MKRTVTVSVFTAAAFFISFAVVGGVSIWQGLKPHAVFATEPVKDQKTYWACWLDENQKTLRCADLVETLSELGILRPRNINEELSL